MDPVLYKAVMEGKIDVVRQYGDQLEVQLTPNNNTVLHVAAQFGQTKCVKEILKMCEGSLLCAKNINGETSLHISCGRQGNYEIVEALIVCAKQVVDRDLESGTTGATKEMLRMTNAEGDTALHQAVLRMTRAEVHNLRNAEAVRGNQLGVLEAVRSNQLGVVDILTKEDPDFVHPPNNAQETPLFLAAERCNTAIVSKILENCTSPAYTGPNGRTALHAATIENWGIGCIRKFHSWKPSLTKKTDVYGWRPLHYAAWYHNVSMVRELLDVDKSVAYLLTEDNDEKKTALHIAASRGNVDVMKEILSGCPDCWEMNNSKGQNILHIAAERDEEETIKYILTKSFASNLINKKDIDGNTPLHLLAANNSTCYKSDLFKNPAVDRKAYNNNTLTAYQVQMEKLGQVPILFEYSRNKFILPKDIEVSGEEDARRRKTNTQLIVATLIATVTFAAGFTIPGGFDGDKGPQQGMAVLARRAAFVIFVLTDAIAMLFSITSVFLHLLMFSTDEDKRLKRYTRTLALTLSLYGMGAMVVAFMTGVYVVLAHSPGLAITIRFTFGFPLGGDPIYKGEPVLEFHAQPTKITEEEPSKGSESGEDQWRLKQNQMMWDFTSHKVASPSPFK